MSSNPSSTPPSASSPGNMVNTGKNLFEKLSLGGKLMCGGAVLAIVATFLSAFSASGSAGGITISNSVMVMEDWRGIVALLGCLGSGLFTLLLTNPKQQSNHHQYLLGSLISSGVAVLMAVLLLVAMSRSGTAISNFGGNLNMGAGIGTYFMLICSIVCLAGAVMNAKAAKLF